MKLYCDRTRSLDALVPGHWGLSKACLCLELIGTSTTSWEEAARNAVERAVETLRELRVAEVVQQDLVITDGKVEAYRTKVKVSFKYEGHQ